MKNAELIKKLFERVYQWEEIAEYATDKSGTESTVLCYLTKRDAGLALFHDMGLFSQYLNYRDARKRKEEAEEDEESRD